MMEVDDLRDLHQLLIRYQDTVPQESVLWKAANEVLLDLTGQVMYQEHRRRTDKP